MTERYDETTGSYGIEYNDVMQPSAGSTGTKTATTGTTGYGQSIILALNSDYAATSACLPPAGYVANSNDCNDSTSSLYQEKNAYLDIDGDGYVSISATSICSGSSLPTGFNGTVGNDCYDLNSNAHLGQTSYFSTDRGDGIYDYDCDGVATMQSPTATPCQQVGSTACSSNVCKVAGSGSPTCGSAIMSTFGGTCATDGSPFYYTASTETCR
jgi:hypothetical protein